RSRGTSHPGVCDGLRFAAQRVERLTKPPLNLGLVARVSGLQGPANRKPRAGLRRQGGEGLEAPDSGPVCPHQRARIFVLEIVYSVTRNARFETFRAH